MSTSIIHPSVGPSCLVRLDNISVELGGVDVLDGITLGVRPGEKIALAGRNGSGKSTLLGVIAGTQDHRRGSVRRRGRVAFVVQRSAVPNTLPVTVRDAVTMGRWAVRGAWRRLTREDHSVVNSRIQQLGLHGLENRPLGELSGGQRQRALVAQGLAQSADILLLDEPTAGLDDDARELIELAIEGEIARGVAVIHATHDDAVMRAADRVVRLREGVFVE